MKKLAPEFDHFNLFCPACGNPSLHQSRAEVGFRLAEDGPGNLSVVDKSGCFITYKTPDQMNELSDENSRRDVIKIYFTCEFCHTFDGQIKHPEIILHIKQHKGSTELFWLENKTNITTNAGK